MVDLLNLLLDGKQCIRRVRFHVVVDMKRQLVGLLLKDLGGVVAGDERPLTGNGLIISLMNQTIGHIHAEGKQQHNGDNQPLMNMMLTPRFIFFSRPHRLCFRQTLIFLLYHLHGSVATGIDNFRQIF